MGNLCSCWEERTHSHMPSLMPVRSLLHLLLTDEDAARLLRVSRTAATQLLQGYTFTQHVFELPSVEAMWRLKALYAAYDLRPTRMALPELVRRAALKGGSGRSPFPSSLTSLLLGPMPRTVEGRVESRCLFGSQAAKVESIQSRWSHPRCETMDERYLDLLMEGNSSPVFHLQPWQSQFDTSLPPGLLPHGLQRLQLPLWLNSSLEVGSIPSTVQVLQLDGHFDQPLSAGQLPSSLVHLVLDCAFNQPLAVGVLSSSLQRLAMDYYNHPLQVGGISVLPSSLQALAMTQYDQPIEPGVLPAGLTHLELGWFNQPLHVGSLPPSLVFLDLYHFTQSLALHELPSSLRVLWLSARCPRVVLPEGLVVLHRRHSDRATVEDFLASLPSTLRVLDLGPFHGGPFRPGSIPAGVRWLRLPEWYREAEAELRLPADTRVEWRTFKGW